MPDSMCEQLYVMTVQIDSAETGDSGAMKLRGHIEYLPNVNLCTMHLFVGEIDSVSRRLAIYETEWNPEDRFSFLGVLSENGRAMSITAYWGGNNRSEGFSLIHESVIDDVIKDLRYVDE